MKKIISISFILAAFLSCKKIPFDYRNKFIGDYVFTKQYKFFYPPNNFIDTIYPAKFNGYIHYGKESHQIEIYYDDFINSIGDKEKLITQVYITRDGVFGGNSPTGKFTNQNELAFAFSTTALGGVGGTTYTGKKK